METEGSEGTAHKIVAATNFHTKKEHTNILGLWQDLFSEMTLPAELNSCSLGALQL